MVDQFVVKWGGTLRAVTKSLLSTIDACLTFYRFPKIGDRLRKVIAKCKRFSGTDY